MSKVFSVHRAATAASLTAIAALSISFSAQAAAVQKSVSAAPCENNDSRSYIQDLPSLQTSICGSISSDNKAVTKSASKENVKKKKKSMSKKPDSTQAGAADEKPAFKKSSAYKDKAAITDKKKPKKKKKKKAKKDKANS